MYKYEMDLASIVEDTERTRFCPLTDRRTRWNLNTPCQLHWRGGYNKSAVSSVIFCYHQKCVLMKKVYIVSCLTYRFVYTIHMDGNTSLSIADWCLSWCGYWYMTISVKTYYILSKMLSYNCRYLDDVHVWKANLKDCGTIAKYIHINIFILEGTNKY